MFYNTKEHQEKNLFIRLFFSVLIFSLVLLPIKFAMPACLPEAVLFPDSLLGWVFFSWPPVFFTFVSALFCVLSLFLIFHSRVYLFGNRDLLFILLLWCSLVPASIPGIVHSTCFDFAMLEFLYVLGLALFSFYIYFAIHSEPAVFRDSAIKGIFWGTLLISIYGIYQYFYGFESTRAIVHNLSVSKDVYINQNILNRLSQDFVFSTFAISNNFAAHLILVLPICLWYAFSLNISKNTKFFLVSLVFAVICLSLLLTGSRGAIASLFLSIIIYSFIFSRSKKRTIIIVAVILGLLLFYFALYDIKPLASSIVRLDYYRVAIVLFLKNPILGAGWGEFFFKYLAMKKFLSVEAAHSPHNFVLFYASQSGILGLLVSTLVLVVPIFITISRIRGKGLKDLFYDIRFAGLVGWTAWGLHSLMDVNSEIPATVALGIVITMLMVSENNVSFEIKEKFDSYHKLFLISVALIIVIGVWMSAKRLSGEFIIQKMNNLGGFSVNSLFSDKKDDVQKDLINMKKLIILAEKNIPYSPIPYSIAGYLGMRTNNWDFAADMFNLAIERSPSDSSYYYALFMIEKNSGNYKEALEYLRKTAALFPLKYEKEYAETYKLYYNEDL